MSNDDRVQYKFMIPSALKERIEDAAHENRRSLSAEIVATLEEKYPAPEPQGIEEMLREQTLEFWQMSEGEREAELALIRMITERIMPDAPQSERDRIMSRYHRIAQAAANLGPYSENVEKHLRSRWAKKASGADDDSLG